MADVLDRFWSKVEVAGPLECWEWTGALTSKGYGNFYVGGGRANPSYTPAHVFAYVLASGPVPDGHNVDHQCHNEALPVCSMGAHCPHRRCVNPAHLSPETPGDNSAASPNSCAAKTHCVHGHEFTEANTYVHEGHRHCRRCRAEAWSAWYERQARRTGTT